MGNTHPDEQTDVSLQWLRDNGIEVETPEDRGPMGPLFTGEAEIDRNMEPAFQSTRDAATREDRGPME